MNRRLDDHGDVMKARSVSLSWMSHNVFAQQSLHVAITLAAINAASLRSWLGQVRRSSS